MSTTQQRLAERASEPQNFTLRAVALGCMIGTVIVFSNMYFGLQTGWISGMNMPGALLGFAAFRGWEAAFPSDRNKLGNGSWSKLRHALRLRMPFSPVENVLVQSVSGSVGTMPLGCGFVGVVIALEKLMRKDTDGVGPIDISLWRLIVWAVGICLFGVVFAVPLRKQVIIKEKLKFPSGTATALMIGVLHGQKGEAKIVHQDESHGHDDDDDGDNESRVDEAERLIRDENRSSFAGEDDPDLASMADWKGEIRNLGLAVLVSAAYVGLRPLNARLVHSSSPLDGLLLLRTSNPQHPCLRNVSRLEMGMDLQSVTGVCWPGHHHGPGNHHAYAPRCYHRLGCIITHCKEQWLGSWRCR